MKRFSNQSIIICVLAVEVAASSVVGITGIVNSSHRADDATARSVRLERRIDQINRANDLSTCRTDLSASAQSELLRGNADVLKALAKVARNSLTEADVDGIEARADSQEAEADRRDKTLALCPVKDQP